MGWARNAKSVKSGADVTRFDSKLSAVVVAITFLHCVSAHGQLAKTEVQKLLASDGATLVRSGRSVADDGDTAVIGAVDAAAKKNVILIMADDFNHWLPAVGYYPLAKTPNLDALAEKGLLFANTSSASPVCSPSRQALWSGLSPARTLIDQNTDPYIRDIPEYSDVLTMNQHFLQEGYYVYGGGKLYHSSRMGVDETDANNWSDVYGGPTGAPAGEYYRWQADADDGRIQWSGSAAPIEKANDTKLAMHMAEKISTYAQSENYDKPFFLAIGFFRPHLPWHAPKQFYDLYDTDRVEIPRGYFDIDLVDIPGAKATEAHREIVDKSKWPEAIRAYLANLSFADYNVGIVLNALERSSYRDNTIVVFTGDHGWHLGEKHRWGKSALYEQASRTTMITFDPGRTTNSGISEKAVSMLDLYPTIASLAGLSVPQHLDGRNLEPLLDSPNDPDWNFPILIRYAGTNVIRTNEWRFVDNGRKSQLYDMVNDPYEFNNLYEDPQYSERVRLLKQQLLALTNYEIDDAPVVTLIGPATLVLDVGDTYTERGATALDPEDGDLTEQVTIDNPVDTSTPGTYTVTYTVQDSGGNEVEAQRTVIVEAAASPPPPVDQPPTITLRGDAIDTLTEGDSYNDEGATASDPEGGDLTARITVDNPVDTSTPGTYIVTYTVEDSGGNEVQAQRTVIVEAAASPPPPPPPPPSREEGGGGAVSPIELLASMLMLLAIGQGQRRSACGRKRPLKTD